MHLFPQCHSSGAVVAFCDIGTVHTSLDLLTYLAGCVQAYGSDVSQWTRQQLINAAGAVTGLSPTEVETLKLDDIESISAVGRHGKWSSTQV